LVKISKNSDHNISFQEKRQLFYRKIGANRKIGQKYSDHNIEPNPRGVEVMFRQQ
jgi:hypothetical protein